MADDRQLTCVLTAWSPRRTREFVLANFHMVFWNNTIMSGILADGTKFRVFPAAEARDAERLRGYEFEAIVQLGTPDPACVEMARICVRP